jgi:hypothetical protein
VTDFPYIAELVAEVKAERMERAKALPPEDQTPERLAVREFCRMEWFRRRVHDMH